MNDPKRIIIVALIAIVMLPLGFFIKAAIDDGGQKTARLYNTAIHVTDAQHFNYSVDTHQGNVITQGNFKADQPAKFGEMNKSFAMVERSKEEYTMHTREVCDTDSDGNEHCHTETYYEWDYVGGDDVSSPTLTFFERKYPTAVFDLGDYERSIDCKDVMPTTSFGWFQEKKGCEDHYYYTDSDTRYYYRVVDNTFDGGFIADVSNGNVKPLSGGTIKLKQQSVQAMIESANDYHLGGNIFIVFWFILILGIMGAIAYAWSMNDGIFSINR